MSSLFVSYSYTDTHRALSGFGWATLTDINREPETHAELQDVVDKLVMQRNASGSKNIIVPLYFKLMGAE